MLSANLDGNGADLRKNHCRNPNNDPRGPWCFDQENRINYCGVEVCGEVGEVALVGWPCFGKKSKKNFFLQKNKFFQHMANLQNPTPSQTLSTILN